MNRYLTELEVRDSHLDDLTHVNNTVYVQWVQEIAGQHWFKLFPNSKIEEEYWVLLEHNIKYHGPAYLGDILVVETCVEAPIGLRFPRIVQFKREGKLIVESRTEWCLVDATTKKPKRVSAVILEKFSIA